MYTINVILFKILKHNTFRGAFSVVKAATRKSDGQKFALKVMQKAGEGDIKKEQIIATEIEILKRVDHPHVVKMEEVFESEKEIILVLQLLVKQTFFYKKNKLK